jgi:ribosome maturation factor RimP
MEKNAKISVVEKLFKITEPVAKELNLDIVDIEYLQDGGYWYVRIYIENPDGEIGLEDCAKLSNRIEEDVDALNIENKFFLEVSSPGIERPLKSEKDFIRFTGEKARLILKHKLEDSRNWTGVISRYENGVIYLEAEEKSLEIPYDEVKKANLVFEFEDF